MDEARLHEESNPPKRDEPVPLNPDANVDEVIETELKQQVFEINVEPI